MARPGLSLIEVLLTASIAVIVVGVVLASLNDAWKDQLTSQAIQLLQQDSRRAVNEIIQSSRGGFAVAGTVEDPDNPGLFLTSDNNVLVVSLNSLNQQGQIVAGTDFVVFRRAAGNQTKLERLTVAHSNSVRKSGKITLANNTAELMLRYFNSSNQEITPGTDDLANTKEIEITVRQQKNVWSRVIDRSFTGRVTLRNSPAGQGGANQNQQPQP